MTKKKAALLGLAVGFVIGWVFVVVVFHPTPGSFGELGPWEGAIIGAMAGALVGYVFGSREKTPPPSGT